LFIVTPYLTKDPSTYGIYAVCISVTIFFSYADLGFLRAGQKYAAESFSRGDRTEEMRYIGFGTFVHLLFTLGLSCVLVYLGYHPNLLIKGLSTPEKISTASNLFLILAGFSPVTAIQRMVGMIFDIRLESYISQRISLFASIITIVSVFYFFREGEYRIVPYYFFSQALNLIAVIICLWLAKIYYAYNLKQLLKCVRFDFDIYKISSGLAYSGLYIVVAFILFYELDQMAISKFLGAEKVAIYAIAFAFATLFRSIFGIFYYPFTVRANHFVGIGDEEGLKKFCLLLVSLSAPLIVIPTVAIALVAKPFILSWVGECLCVNFHNVFHRLHCKHDSYS
jgi:O-antigen/teichoic acid export membrane protein